MKKIIMAFALVCSVPAFAGKMKEIYIMTEDSVMEYLGFDYDMVRLEDVRFTTVEGVDLAVQSRVRMPYASEYSSPYVKCLTTFKANDTGFYSVIGTRCQDEN